MPASAWFGDARYYDLITILDDATSEIYYAQLGQEEGTRTLMPAIRDVVQKHGIFCALYSDRASHFFVIPKAGGKIDPNRLTQLGRALQDWGSMIPAYSPQARGRMNAATGLGKDGCRKSCGFARSTRWSRPIAFCPRSTWRSLIVVFAVAAAGKGSAFVRTRRKDLEYVFSLQQERSVNRDKAGYTVTIYELLDGTTVVRYGPHEVARFEPGQLPEKKPTRKAASPRPVSVDRGFWGW